MALAFWYVPNRGAWHFERAVSYLGECAVAISIKSDLSCAHVVFRVQKPPGLRDSLLCYILEEKNAKINLSHPTSPLGVPFLPKHCPISTHSAPILPKPIHIKYLQKYIII